MTNNSILPFKLVIINTSTGWGGLELNVVKLAREFAKKGIELYWVVRADSKFSEEVTQEFSNVLVLKKVKKYFDFKNAKIVSKFINAQSIDVVFTAFRPDLDLIFWTKRKSQRYLKVVHQQQMQIGIPKKGVIQRLRYSCVDDWISPLEILKKEVLEKTVIPATKISIIPLGVDVNHFLSKTYSRSEAQKLLKCSTTSTLIGVIGRIESKKGQLFLTKALKELRQNGEDVALLIVGAPTIDDPNSIVYNEQLIDYIKNNDLSEFVFFSGFTKDISQFYGAIDLFVMSSESETFGMVTLEAMLSQKPIIGTNAGGTPELLNQGEYGELYQYGNSQSFVKAYHSIRERISNGNYSTENNKKRVIEKYSLEIEVEGFMKLFSKYH